MQKIIFIPHLFLEILQGYCRLVILGTLSAPGHTHQKQQHELIGNSDIYLHKKYQLDSSKFYRDFTL